MKKIPTIFQRDWDNNPSRVLNIPNPACDWVFLGEGTATRKIDGTSCLVRKGLLFRRREIKPEQPIPGNFTREGTDPETGKLVGWVPVGDGPEDKYHRAAFAAAGELSEGTYELVGPNVQKNPEKLTQNVLIRHGQDIAGALDDVPREFDALAKWLKDHDVEGIVWHHPDGRMAKVKGRDFGISRT